jgi:tRNA(fMet)-specific endonuclease VapC
MNRIVVDTDIATYIFNWHSSAQRYVDALRGAELILAFPSIAEMRMRAMAEGWGLRRRNCLERFMRSFGAAYADDALCTSWAALRARARSAGRSLSPQDAWIAATALRLDAPMATNNRSAFEHIEKLRLLWPRAYSAEG